jgi:RNA polymerase sigma-54 factor
MSQSRLRQEQRQQQTLTPRLQQAVRLLQLSSLDFALEVSRAMESNPFLETEEGEGDAATAAAIDAREAPAPASTMMSAADGTPITVIDAPPDPQGDGEWEASAWAQYGSPAGGKKGNGGDSDFDYADLAAVDVTLREHLRQQLALLPSSPRDRTLMLTLVEALDDDGYLRVGLDEVAALVALDPPAEEDELMVALRLIQSLEPAGVGARDLRECLRLQLREAENGDARVCALATRIVDECLERVAVRDASGIARALNAPIVDVEQAVARIRRLQPRPGWRYGATDTRFITPDIIVRKLRDEWTVTLNPDIMPRVRLNRMYADLFRSHRDASHGDLAAQLQEARWTVRNVEQRFSTILRVGQAIVRRQRNFLDYGELAMKPLGLREIAEELGLHESTVSRVTNNKYMATPMGVFELKFFFSRSLATASGGTCSTTAIRGAIKEMIEEEDATSPLSDAHIARLLSRQGLKVARRTVTKYRQMMKVPPYESRRERKLEAVAR